MAPDTTLLAIIAHAFIASITKGVERMSGANASPTGRSHWGMIRRMGLVTLLIFMLGRVGAGGAAVRASFYNSEGLAGRPEKPIAMGHVFGRLHRATAQPVETIDAAKRGGTRAAVDVPDRYTGLPGRGIENTPLVVDGVFYVTGNDNQAWAIDGRTGRPLWTYRRSCRRTFLPRSAAGRSIGALAILGDRLYMGTLDAHLVALDRNTGVVLWDVAVGDLKNANAITAAPLVVKNKVIVGVAGGDFSSRGYIDAYDARDRQTRLALLHDSFAGRTRQRSWPNAEVAARGGGAAWVTGSYDPALNLVYYGTGNPNPDYYGDDRNGDNLYTCSLVAIDADTGKLRWHLPVHAPRCSRLGFDAYTRAGRHDDRRPGSTSDHGRQPKWIFLYARSRDRETARRETIHRPSQLGSRSWLRRPSDRARRYRLAGKCLPDNHGGTDFQPPTFDPDLKLFFVTAHETCAVWEPKKPDGADRSGRACTERRSRARRWI